jgi:hypothetical protein
MLPNQLRFTTPDGQRWTYASEFSGYWVSFPREDGTRWITGSMPPQREFTDETLSAALLELWQRRKAFRRKQAATQRDQSATK